ncbi:transposase [Salmonella enterica]|nr:transposase [Salmonella enterica]
MRAKERLPRKRYSPEFKMELVRLALEKEGSVAALARQHDVNDNLLFKWIRLWQREGRVCYPRKNSLSLPVLIPVQLRAEPSSPTSEPPSCSPQTACHIKCRGGDITLTHPSAWVAKTSCSSVSTMVVSAELCCTVLSGGAN